MDLETNHLAATHLADPAIAWSLGSFGAIAEFMWHPAEATWAHSPFERITGRGGIRIAPPAATCAIATRTPSRDPARRHRGLALCLPRDDSAMARHAVVTEIGPDTESLRPEDRDALLFDMGLAQWQVDVMVRTRDPEAITLLRGAAGHSLFDPGQSLMAAMPRLSPHRVFASRCGRIEVFGAIPPPGGLSPDGPHTHVLPKLLRHNRTHAANIGIPEGLIPCLSLHFARPDPAHALNSEGDAYEVPHAPR